MVDVKDLIERLNSLASETTLKCWEPRHGAWLSGLREAAEALSRLSGERDAEHAAYDGLMKAKEAFRSEAHRNGRALADARSRAETAERQRAEAIERAAKLSEALDVARVGLTEINCTTPLDQQIRDISLAKIAWAL